MSRGAGRGSGPPVTGAEKWLPRIDVDACTGCGECIRACRGGSLQMVWAFATLVRPETCDGDAACERACPERLIRMAWAPADGDRGIGRWREGGEPVIAAEGGRRVLADLMGPLTAGAGTPLAFGVDAGAVAAWAREREETRTGRPPPDEEIRDALAATLGLDRLPSPDLPGLIRRLDAACRRTHPDAARIVALRADGWTPRDAAARLGLGLRLVESVLADVGRSLAGEPP